MKYTNDWSDLLATLAEDIPAEELEADMLLADIAGKISAERIKRGLSQQAFADLLTAVLAVVLAVILLPELRGRKAESRKIAFVDE